jgi:hypothetical protein
MKKIKYMTTAKQKFISNKISKIMKEGVRRNTHAPVSSSNARRPVSQKQAIAIAESMARRKK